MAEKVIDFPRRNNSEPPQSGGSEPPVDLSGRVAKLETIAEHTENALNRIDRSITELRAEFDRKFMWMIGTQVAILLAIIGILAKAAHIF